jgi:hypothetical protein
MAFCLFCKQSTTETFFTMLEHQKKVLEAVSYDKALFRKELLKSLTWLNSEELTHLQLWLRENFYPEYANVIMEVFYPKYDVASHN